MKIIHCSDLHLDSKMQSNLSVAQAKTRQKEILKTFARLCEYAVKNKVEAVLICGDMFDTLSTSAATLEYCASCIKAAAEVNFFIIFGNHDEQTTFAKLTLPNLFTFGDSWKTYTLESVTISGKNVGDNSFDGLVLNNNTTNIVMLHGQESAYENIPEGINLTKAKNNNIDYLALGHLHYHKVAKLDSRGIYAYSGCLEGRGFDETGSKGFIVLDIEQDKPIKPRFIDFACRTLHIVTVDITDIEDYYSIESAVANAVAHIDESDIVRIVLVGTYTLNTRKDIKMLTELVLNRFFYTQVIDDSTLYIDKKSYEKDISLKGEFIRLVYSLELPEKDKDSIIITGIKALAGEEIL